MDNPFLNKMPRKFSTRSPRVRLLAGVSLALFGVGALAIADELAQTIVVQYQDITQENEAVIEPIVDPLSGDTSNAANVWQENMNPQQGIAEALASGIAIDTDNPLGEGIGANTIAEASVEQQQDVNQANVAEVGQDAQASDGDASNDAEIDQSNENAQIGVAEATAGGIAISNTGDIAAGGEGIAANTIAEASVEQQHDVNQANIAELGQDAQAPDGDASNDAEIDQSNENAQIGVAEATEGGIAISNSGDITAGGEGIVANAAAEAFVQQQQEVDQGNVAKLDRDAQAAYGHASNSTEIGQSNADAQIGVAGASAGDTAINNSGDINAGGDGIVANSSAIAHLQQDQNANQTNIAVVAQEAQAPDGHASNAAEIDQSNENAQIGVAGASAGDTAINNSGDINAGGDGIVANASAIAYVQQDQDVGQVNAAVLDQDAQAPDGDASNFAHIDQSNVNAQIGVAEASAGDIAINNSGNINAGGDGIVAISSAVAHIQQNQSSTQVNAVDLDQDIEALDEDGSNVAEIDQSNENVQIGIADATAGHVFVNNSSNIVAAGRGVVAQSLANGSVALAGTVDVINSGNISAGKEGIVASSSANDGRGSNITVTNAGTVMGGDGYYGLALSGGATNTIINFGTIGSLSNQAIAGTSGDETVNNHGTVTGDVSLGSGNNTFFNQNGAWFNTWDLVGLNGGVLTNSGVLAPGGEGRIQTTVIDGDFVNTMAGQLLIDADMVSGASDRLDISGTANFAGELVPTLRNPAHRQSFTVATAAGGVTDAGLGVADSFWANYDLSYPTPQDVVLSVTIDMTSNFEGLNQNQQAIGQFLNRAFIGGIPSELSDLYGSLFTISDIASLSAAYDQLSPELYLQSAFSTLFAGQSFSNDLMSCSARTGAYVFVQQEECAWARLSGSDLSVKSTPSQIGYGEQSIAMSGGLQTEIAGDLHLGFGIGMARSRLEAATGSVSHSSGLHGGVTLKHTSGPWLFAGAISAGYNWHDTTRPVALPGFTTLAASQHGTWDITGRLRTAYMFDIGGAYLKPRVDLTVSHFGSSGFTESGGATALTVRRMRDSMVSISPALEWGAELKLRNGAAIRPYASIGVTGFSSGERALLASFSGASGTTPFRITTKADRLQADVGAGVEVLGTGNASLRLDYSGRFSRNVEQYGFSAKATFSF